MALPPPSPTSTCLVTGASSGIGADIARELAQRGQNLTLSARREDRLEELATELRKTGVRVDVVACDVTDAGSRADLIAKIAGDGLDVEVLVNNAGYGSGGPFHELDGEGEVQMVKTNCSPRSSRAPRPISPRRTCRPASGATCSWRCRTSSARCC